MALSLPTQAVLSNSSASNSSVTDSVSVGVGVAEV